MQGISHDRILMRLVNYTQIIGWVVGFFWGAVQIIRYIDAMNVRLDLVQKQNDATQHQITRLERYVRRQVEQE